MILIDSATLSMNGAVKPVEIYVPLWFADGTSMNFLGTNHNYVTDGSTGGSASMVSIFTVSSNWPANVNFAFEATIYTNNSSYTAYANLVDVTSGVDSGYRGVSTVSTTATIVRSTQGTLIPGHSYGIYINSNNASGRVYFVDASLIIFP